MPYDPTRPAESEFLQAGDDLFRNDKTFMKDGLEREHHFDGTETAGASGDHLVHKMGSARTFIYTGGTALTTGTLASAYSQSKVRNTGLIVVDHLGGGTPNGARVWYCIDGAADTWVEMGKLGAALALASTLSVAGDTTLAGHLTMALTKKLRVPSAESSLEDLTVPATTMNPFVHGAARHQTAGGEGTWLRPLDPLRGLLVGYKTASNLVPANLTGSFANYVSLTYNLNGGASPRTQNSRIGLLAVLNLRNVLNFPWQGEARLMVNAAASPLAPVAQIGQTRQDFAPQNTGDFLFDLFDVAAGTNYTYSLQARETGGTGEFFSGYLWLLDFGEVA